MFVHGHVDDSLSPEMGSCATRVSTPGTDPAALTENHIPHEGPEELRGQGAKAPFTGGGRWKGRAGRRSDILTIQTGGVGPRFSLFPMRGDIKAKMPATTFPSRGHHRGLAPGHGPPGTGSS